MIPMFKKAIHALLWDELAARRWIRFALLALGGAGISVASVGWEVASSWTARDWFGHLVFAAVLGMGGMVTAGEKNRPIIQGAPPPAEPQT